MKKVLIIEDESDIRESLADSLGLNGFETFMAENGRQGLLMAHALLPDLILSDIMMPDLNGLELLRLLQTNEDLCHIPFVFLTAKTTHDDMRLGMNLGADDYLTKPVRMNVLVDTIKRRIAKSEQLRTSMENKMLQDINNMNLVTTHEFNTPLNGILGFAQLLEYDITADLQSRQTCAKAIYDSGKRLQHTLNNLLWYRRLATKEEQAEREIYVVDAELYQSIWDELNERYQQEHDLDLNAVQAQLLNVGPTQVKKVLLELLDNVFKYSFPRSPVRIAQHALGQHALITISSFGRGIKPEHVERIGPFRQFDRDIYEQQGLGLGLYIGRSLCELNGGSLSIATEQPSGAVVCKLRLPLANI